MEIKSLLPLEVSELANKVDASKKQEIETVLQQIFIGTNEWEAQVEAINVKDVNDKLSIELADVARKNAKTARLNAEKIFDAKRAEVQNIKSQYDNEDKLWLKAKQVMQLKFKLIEEKAEWKANFVKRFEAEQKELRTQSRITQVMQYAEINRIEFENMSDESFESFLNGLKSTYEAKKLAELKAEEERIAKEIAEAAERERVRLENEKLKAEAAEKEKQLQEERAKAEAERKAIEEKARKEKLEAELKAAEILKAEQEAKAKIEAELKAKKEAEEKAEKERLAEIERQKKEAEKLAKAPVKKQLTVWVDDFKLPEIQINHETSTLIKTKFEAFKKWAKEQIETI